MTSLPEINAIPIFEETQMELISLLKSLSEDEWNHPTSSSSWNVKDIVAHLLDGDIRRLSLHRDKHILPLSSTQINDYKSLVAFLNDLNNTWVKAAKRLSPVMLIELTEFTTPKVLNHLKSLDPKGRALFSVEWAGEEESENWFDIAREYTEKWYHQQQIREALDKQLLISKKWLSPLIDTLIRGIPPVYNYHAAEYAENQITITITGTIDDSWLLAKENVQWKLFKSKNRKSLNKIRMDDDTAWRLFTKNISKEEAINRIEVEGNKEFGNLIAQTVSFMK